MNLVSKNNVGYALILLLIVILTQGKTLNFLIDTYLGRIFTILLLLIVSYCNKILGVVFVFLIIISFNKNSLFEGLETNAPSLANAPTMSTGDAIQTAVGNKNASTTTTTATPPPPTTASLTNVSLPSMTPATPIATAASMTPATPIATAASMTPATPIATAAANANVSQPIMSSMGNTTTQPIESASLEGFDLLGTENNIRRGKESNSISVNKYSQNSDNVIPIDSTYLFKENYSIF